MHDKLIRVSGTYMGQWRHEFPVTSVADLRRGCYQTWEAFEAMLATEQKNAMFPLMLSVRDPLAKRERHVPASFTFPPEGTMTFPTVPHPFRDSGTDWEALLRQLRKAHTHVLRASAIMDRYDHLADAEPSTPPEQEQ